VRSGWERQATKPRERPKEVIGRVTHDRRLERQGKGDQKRADVKEKARDAVDTVKEKAPKVVDTVKEKARDAVDKTKRKIRQ
jgi:uncharacterized protein YjbJ (UPF0337 family)